MTTEIISRANREWPQSPARAAHFAGLNSADFAQAFTRQNEFLHIPDFLPTERLAAIQARLPALASQVHRNYIPGHKKGGSISRFTLAERAPDIAKLYEDAALKAWLSALCGEQLMPSPEDDPHAYALYYYTEAGDHIGYHYDSSYYRGRRYTVLIGLVDNSSSRLQYQLYRDLDQTTEQGSIALRPGAMLFFNGDKLYHRVTPLGEGEERVVLALEYVTDARIHPWRRFVSDMKDAIAYFGFRQVLGRRRGRKPA